MAHVTRRFATTGLHCPSCSMLVDMTLADIDGVSESKTDHTTGTSAVTFDDAVVTADDICAAVRSVGYEAELLG